MKTSPKLNIPTTRLLAMVFALAFAAPVFALELPRNAVITLVSDAGTQIGVGQVGIDELELDVLRGASGFATLTITTADGQTVSYEALFSGTGQVLVVVDGEVVDLRDLASSAGLEYELEYENRLDGRNGTGDRDDDDDGDDDDRDGRDDDDGDRDDRDDDADSDDDDDADSDDDDDDDSDDDDDDDSDDQDDDNDDDDDDDD